jgi:hypothetical protein
MQQFPSWETNGSWTSQEIFHPVWKCRFTTMLTGAHHWSLFRATWIQSTPSDPIFLTSVLILSYHLRPALTCSDWNFVCISHLSHACYMHRPSHPHWYDHLNNIWPYKLWSSSHTRVYPKVSGLAAWSENCKLYSSLPLDAIVSLLCESV